MHEKKLETAGKSLEEASKALIMLHGRGGIAKDFLKLAKHLEVDDFALIAPEAYNNSWYPLSFMAPENQNEPWLSSALNLIKEIEEDLNQQGIASENIYFFGFSQGACLILEYMTRNAKKYGGAVAIIGGLIGEKINTGNYITDFQGTRILLATSDPDMHVPLKRVERTAEILKLKNADVHFKVYRNTGHTLLQEEMDLANELIFKDENFSHL